MPVSASIFEISSLVEAFSTSTPKSSSAAYFRLFGRGSNFLQLFLSSLTACAGRITKQLRRVLEAFLIRRRVVLEVKHPLATLDGRGVQAGFQDRDGESMTLTSCPLNIDGPLTIDGEATILGLEHPVAVVVERQVDVLDADGPSALSM